MNEYTEDLAYKPEIVSVNYTLEEQRFLVALMIWSFSRINAYHICPYEWKMKYLFGQYGKSSAMAEYGGYNHEIFERYYKGELDAFELPIYYEDHYDENITQPFPYNNYVDLAEKYYQQGLEFFENFTEYELFMSDEFLSRYEILGVEKEVKFEYEGYQFVGYIDLLIRDKEDGKLIILDHKSATLKILKSGKISKTDQEHFLEFKRQLYLYSHAVIQEYGEGSVKALEWNLFRLGTTYQIPWKKKEYKEAMDWAVSTIKTIEEEVAWAPTDELTAAMMDMKYPPFYCMNLCSQRDVCEHKLEHLSTLRSLNDEDDYNGEM